MTGEIHGWHAHVYYDATSKPVAEAVRAGLAQAIPGAVLGRWHDNPVGPHPRGSYQVAFGPALMPAVVPWLMLHRQGLTVLLHPETGHERADHTTHAAWMGEMLPLDLSALDAD